ncbi:hypothetical protein P9112_012588 [Eukaryota sp. TZLM1-RC]
MSKPRADRFDFIGRKATLDVYDFRIRWLEVMEYGRDFSNNLDGPENIHLLPDWFRPGLDKIYEVNSVSGMDYTVVREVYECYPSSSNPDLVEMRPASQPFRLIFVEQGVTFKRDHANMKTAVISTYRSPPPPNHHNVQIGDTWVNNKAFAFTPILGIEDTPFQSIRPFRPSIQLNIQEEPKPLQKLQIDQLPQPGNQDISMEVLTIQPSDTSVPMEESTSRQTGPGLSRQDLSSSRSDTSSGIHDPRQVLDLNLQSHVGYHYRTKAVEHETLHEPPRLEFPETQMKIVHFLLEFALWDNTGRGGTTNVDTIEMPQTSSAQQQKQIADMVNSLSQLLAIQGGATTEIQQQIDSLKSQLESLRTPKIYRIDPNFIQKIGPPIHAYDLFRSILATTNPVGISGCISARIISFWKQQQILSMEPTDAEILLLLCRRSQFNSLHDAKLALHKPQFNWRKVNSIEDAEREFAIYMENFGDILRMSTYITDVSARIEDVVHSSGVFTLPMSTVAHAFLTGINNLAFTEPLFEEFCKESYWKDKLVSFPKLTRKVRNDLLTWMKVAQNRETVQLLRKAASRPKIETGDFHTSAGKKRTSQPDSSIPNLKKEKHYRGGHKFCTFCQKAGHVITECEDPGCTRSLVPLDQRRSAGRSRGRGKPFRGSYDSFKNSQRGHSRGQGRFRGRGGRGTRGNKHRAYMFHIHQSSHATAPELSHTYTTSQSEHPAQASLLNPLSFK